MYEFFAVRKKTPRAENVQGCTFKKAGTDAGGFLSVRVFLPQGKKLEAENVQGCTFSAGILTKPQNPYRIGSTPALRECGPQKCVHRREHEKIRAYDGFSGGRGYL